MNFVVQYVIIETHLKIQGVNTLATKSRENLQDDVYPTPEDTAIVMYTSGSTGTPKVLVSYENTIQVFIYLSRRFYITYIDFVRELF